MYRKSNVVLALLLVMLMLMSACNIGSTMDGRKLPVDVTLDDLEPDDTTQPEPSASLEDLEDLAEEDNLVVVPDETCEITPEPEETPEPEDTPEPAKTIELNKTSKPKETSQPISSPTTSPTKKPSLKYMLEVDVTNQVVTAYGQDSNGEYTKVVRQMICSTGKPSTPTPLKTYTMPGATRDRARWYYFHKFGTWAQYMSRIHRGYLFHSILYDSADESTLKQSTFNALGTPVSAGCIRLMVNDAKWVYTNAKAGTTVKIIQKKKDVEYAKGVKAASIGSALPLSIRIASTDTIEKIELKAGDSMQIQGLVTFTGNTEKDETKNISWSFSKNGIAQVNGNTLLAVAPGNVVMTAKYKDVSTKVEVAIFEPGPTPTPSPTPSLSPTSSLSPTPTASPTPSPTPTATPTASPTPEPKSEL